MAGKHSQTKLIGVTGFAYSGKDTVGKILCDKHGFTRLAFGDAVKLCAYALNPVIPIEVSVPLDIKKLPDPRTDIALPVKSEIRMRYLQEIANENGGREDPVAGINAVKHVPEVRRTLQRLGTEVGRNILGEDTWTNVVLRHFYKYSADYVITDVRFPNEALAIRTAGGAIWRVKRDVAVEKLEGDAAQHASETQINNIAYDVEIENNASLDDLERLVDYFMDLK